MTDSPETSPFGVHRSGTPEDTTAIGAALAATLKPGDLVCLSGDLGTGKSVMARAIARKLGVSDRMPSPSYTIVEEYQGTVPVLHIDLYRLADEDEFFMLGIESAMAMAVSIVEWPERAPSLLTEATVRVSIAISPSPEARRIEISRGTS